MVILIPYPYLFAFSQKEKLQKRKIPWIIMEISSLPSAFTTLSTLQHYDNQFLFFNNLTPKYNNTITLFASVTFLNELTGLE